MGLSPRTARPEVRYQPTVSVSAAAIFLHEVLTRKSIKMHSFCMKIHTFSEVFEEQLEFPEQEKISGTLSLLRSCPKIIRIDFWYFSRPEKIFAWGDSTFFINALNIRKFPLWYGISMVFYRKALHERKMKNLPDPVAFFIKIIKSPQRNFRFSKPKSGICFISS